MRLPFGWRVAVMGSHPWLLPVQVVIRHHGRIVWLLDEREGT